MPTIDRVATKSQDAERRVLSLLTEVPQMDIVTLFRQCKLGPVVFRDAVLSLLRQNKIHGMSGCMGKFWSLSKKQWERERHFFYSQGVSNADYEGLRKAVGRLKDFDWVYLVADARERTECQRIRLGLIG